jgi:hypothetical protein
VDGYTRQRPCRSPPRLTTGNNSAALSHPQEIMCFDVSMYINGDPA